MKLSFDILLESGVNKKWTTKSFLKKLTRLAIVMLVTTLCWKQRYISSPPSVTNIMIIVRLKEFKYSIKLCLWRRSRINAVCLFSKFRVFLILRYVNTFDKIRYFFNITIRRYVYKIRYFISQDTYVVFKIRIL